MNGNTCRWALAAMVISGVSLAALSTIAYADEAEIISPPSEKAAERAVSPEAGAAKAEDAGTTSGAQAGATSASTEPVAPGPLMDARKLLYDRIMQAKSEGIGIRNYQLAFNGIEDCVKAGQTADQVRPRIETLARALKEQLDKGKVLKTQRPTPGGPSGHESASAGGAPSDALIKAALAKTGLGNDPAAMAKIRDKLNSPELQNIPDSVKQRILQSGKAQELMKQFGL